MGDWRMENGAQQEVLVELSDKILELRKLMDQYSSIVNRLGDKFGSTIEVVEELAENWCYKCGKFGAEYKRDRILYCTSCFYQEEFKF